MRPRAAKRQDRGRRRWTARVKASARMRINMVGSFLIASTIYKPYRAVECRPGSWHETSGVGGEADMLTSLNRRAETLADLRVVTNSVRLQR